MVFIILQLCQYLCYIGQSFLILKLCSNEADISSKLYPILLTKITAAKNEVALCYHTVRGLYFLAVAFVGAIVYLYDDEHAPHHPAIRLYTIYCNELLNLS